MKPKVVLVGGLGFNVPGELHEYVEVVKHIEQTSSFRVGTMPAADYIFVISDFASHNLVESVSKQLDVPIIRLQKGWSNMKTELQKRSIVPPDQGRTARVAEAAEPEETPQSPTTTGLSESELWKLYRTKLIEAAKGALKPKDLLSEADLCEILGDLVGIPKEDLTLLLPRLQLGGTLSLLPSGLWSLMVSEDGYEVDLSPPEAPKPRRASYGATDRRASAAKTDRYERAKLISGLLLGPYPTVMALIREMQKYKEFQHEDGTPLTVEGCRNLVKKAIELKIVDDTHQKIFVDHKPDIVLTRLAPPEVEIKPLLPPPLSADGKKEEYVEQIVKQDNHAKLEKLSKEEAEKAWCYVVGEVKRQKRHIGTILENGRIEWLADSSILVFLIPQTFSIYRSQLESTENWGLINIHARTRFGASVVIRFVLDNGAAKGRVS